MKNSMGQFIAALRKANGLTQQQLADKLNVSNKAVSRWERDECAPDISLIAPLSEILGVSCDELLKGERIPQENIEKAAPKIESQVNYLVNRHLNRALLFLSCAILFNCFIFLISCYIYSPYTYIDNLDIYYVLIFVLSLISLFFPIFSFFYLKEKLYGNELIKNTFTSENWLTIKHKLFNIVFPLILSYPTLYFLDYMRIHFGFTLFEFIYMIIPIFLIIHKITYTLVFKERINFKNLIITFIQLSIPSAIMIIGTKTGYINYFSKFKYYINGFLYNDDALSISLFLLIWIILITGFIYFKKRKPSILYLGVRNTALWCYVILPCAAYSLRVKGEIEITFNKIWFFWKDIKYYTYRQINMMPFYIFAIVITIVLCLSQYKINNNQTNKKKI